MKLTNILFALLVGIIILYSSQLLLAQESLQDMLSDEHCEQACFLGIEPGSTSRSELENILDEHNIDYLVQPMGLSGIGYNYLFYPENRWIEDEKVISIIAGEDTVGQMVIPIVDIPVEDVLGSYGSPTNILEQSKSFILLYRSEGIVFFVPKNGSVVSNLMIYPNYGITTVFSEAHYPSIYPCVEPAILCNIATATPSPPDPLQLSSLCSPAPTTTRRWLVQNPNLTDITFTWELAGSDQTGSSTVPSVNINGTPGEMSFETIVVSDDNIVRVLLDGELQDEQVSSGERCAPNSVASGVSHTVKKDVPDTCELEGHPLLDALTRRVLPPLE